MPENFELGTLPGTETTGMSIWV